MGPVKKHENVMLDDKPNANKYPSRLSDPYSGSYMYGSSPEADKIYRQRAAAAEAKAKKAKK